MKIFLCALILLTTATHAVAADTVYVQSSKAKIFSNPSFQSQLVVTANKGDALTRLETSDQWVKVSYQQHTGWIAALLVNSKPPQDKITVIKGQDGGTPKDDARRRASSSVRSSWNTRFQMSLNSRRSSSVSCIPSTVAGVGVHD